MKQSIIVSTPRQKNPMIRNPTMKIIMLITLFLLHQFDLQNLITKTSLISRSHLENGMFLGHPNGCQGHESGYTFPCPCSTGMIHMNNNKNNEEDTLLKRKVRTIVFNQCILGRKNGAYYGIDRVQIRSKDHGEMGMAVYSAHLNLCGGKDRECFCTCFDQDAVEGAVGFRTSISIRNHDNNSEALEGYVTDCLGLCGPHCEQGGNSNDGNRYASILIHDICQSFIRSYDPMPNKNLCSDEGWSAFPAALLSVVTNGFCPSSS